MIFGGDITDNFTKLSKEKQKAVLSAGYICFGKNGYKKTSMMDIAQQAGISKASLFQYFGTKRQMYRYLYQYAVDLIIKKLPEGTDDLFECIEKITEAKMRIVSEYPGMYDFIASSISEGDPEIADDLEKMNKENTNMGMDMLFAKVDFGRFKPGVDMKIVNNLLIWISEGLIRSSVGSISAENIIKELEIYMELLKKTLYREEYL